MLYDLKQSEDLFKYIKPDRRMWYLADGSTSFFLTDQKFVVTSLYTILAENSTKEYWDSYSLGKVLWGSDIAFRVINHNQISIVNADGIEFISVENTWKLRDYKIIKTIFVEYTDLNENVIDCVIYYALQCAQNNESSILWFPKNSSEDKLKEVLIECITTFDGVIDITDEKNVELVKRIISSDGVTIINAQGEMIYNGCVVNLNRTSKAKKMIGTGESAAHLLAQNGLALKVSQDGYIKVYYDYAEPAFIF